MFRIDGPGHVGNQFTQGDPGIGQRPTKVTSEWLNAVQEEIAFACEEAGIVLDKEDPHQLYAAILAIAAGAAGSGGGAVPSPTLSDAFGTMCVFADCSGGRTDYAAQDNNPFVSGASAGAISIFNSGDVSVSGTYFALGF